jgi:hypothetical protein
VVEDEHRPVPAAGGGHGTTGPGGRPGDLHRTPRCGAGGRRTGAAGLRGQDRPSGGAGRGHAPRHRRPPGDRRSPHRCASVGAAGSENLLETLLDQAGPGFADLAADRQALAGRAADRLAFRELGLAIGLRAVQRIQALHAQHPAAFAALPAFGARLERLERYALWSATIEGFWLEPAHHTVETWKDHEDINAVMLATSLAPDGYLAL